MGTVTSTKKGPAFSSDGGNASVFFDSKAVTNADIDAADIIKLCRVAAGTDVHRVTVKTTELDTNGSPTLTAKIGFTPVDGSAAVSGADVAVLADAAWGNNAETVLTEVFPPYRVEVDSWLTIVIGTGANTEAATGTVYAKVEGESIGVQ
jgi:hypothetical protein